MGVQPGVFRRPLPTRIRKRRQRVHLHLYLHTVTIKLIFNVTHVFQSVDAGYG